MAYSISKKASLLVGCLLFAQVSLIGAAAQERVKGHGPGPGEDMNSLPKGRPVLETNPPPTRQGILESLAERGTDSPFISFERTDLVKAYIHVLKDLSAEERKIAAEEFFKTSSFETDHDDFFEFMKELPNEIKTDIEEGILKLPPEETLSLLEFLSEGGQTKAIERLVHEAKKDPDLIRVVALWAPGLNLKLKREDLTRFIFVEKRPYPEFLRQFAKNNPEGTQRLWDHFKKAYSESDRAITNSGKNTDGSPIEEVDFREAVLSAIKSGDIQLTLQQLKELKAHAANYDPFEPGESFSSKKAYEVLSSISPKEARDLIETLSQSKSPEDLIKAAKWVGDKDPRLAEILNRALREADRKILDYVSRHFSSFELSFSGVRSQHLKYLARKGMESAGLELLSRPESFTEGLAFIRNGLEKDPQPTLRILDALNPESARRFRSVAPAAMAEVLKEMEKRQTTTNRIQIHGAKFASLFPEVLRPQVEKLEVLVGSSTGDIALQLLGEIQNPQHLERYMRFINQPVDSRSFPASQALGKLLSAKPELVTFELEERLRKILEAKDENDLNRLHLRQHLPEAVMLRLDQQILDSQLPDPKRFDAVQIKTAEAAQAILNQAPGTIGLMEAGQKALAVEFLIRSGHPEAPRLLEDFLKTVSASSIQRYIHNINSIQGALQAAQQSGINVNPDTVKEVHATLNTEVDKLWNRGDPEMRHVSLNSNLINSNLVPFAAAINITSAVNLLEPNPTQEGILKRLREMQGNPAPYHFPNEKKLTLLDKGAALNKAPTSGRSVSAGLALYLTAPKEDRAQTAKALLDSTRTYLQSFSQTHEIPRGSDRYHDRTPGSQGMAAYYGFANDPNAMVALRYLSQDSLLTQKERQEASTLATQLQNRLLSLTEKDGTVYQRPLESFANENRVYQILTGISLIHGQQAQLPGSYTKPAPKQVLNTPQLY